MKFLIYHPHSENYFLLCTPRAMKLMHAICKQFGDDSNCNAWQFHDGQVVVRSPLYAELIHEHQRALTELDAIREESQLPPSMRVPQCWTHHQPLIHVEPHIEHLDDGFVIYAEPVEDTPQQ